MLEKIKFYRMDFIPKNIVFKIKKQCSLFNLEIIFY